MTAFIEDARFPTNISKGALGGPQFSTDIVSTASGFEKRNINWAKSKAKYEVSHAVRTEAEYAQLLAFFNIARGRANGFRFKDWMDYKVSSTEGRVTGALEALDGSLNSLQDGYKYYQLAKLYKFGIVTSDYYLRNIRKPISTITVSRNGTPIAIHGSTAGLINNINYATGVVTFNLSNSFVLQNNTITKGATTKVYLQGNQVSTLPIGSKLYFESDVNIPELKDTRHVVSGVSYTTYTEVTLSTNSTNYTGTTISGSLSKYQQGNEILTWTGEYDIPCRFDIDSMEGSLDTHISSSWSNIPIVELRV
jgi:uncharacterized protein (TIGR02217 family)